LQKCELPGVVQRAGGREAWRLAEPAARATVPGRGLTAGRRPEFNPARRVPSDHARGSGPAFR